MKIKVIMGVPAEVPPMEPHVEIEIDGVRRVLAPKRTHYAQKRFGGTDFFEAEVEV